MEIKDAMSLGLNSLEHIKNLELEAVTNSDSMLTERRRMLQNKSFFLAGNWCANIHRAQKQFVVNNISPDAYQKF